MEWQGWGMVRRQGVGKVVHLPADCSPWFRYACDLTASPLCDCTSAAAPAVLVTGTPAPRANVSSSLVAGAAYVFCVAAVGVGANHTSLHSPAMQYVQMFRGKAGRSE